MNVIYARQSVDKKDSLSIDGQIDLCRRLAGAQARVFADRGYSGKNIKRPAFSDLIEEIKSGTVKKIFVYRLDRFSRSIADFGRLWELLETHGVGFVSVTEQFDTTSPMGRAMLNIVLVFAQLERETTSQRVKDNYLHRHALGAWPGGPPPYGFDLDKVTVEGKRYSTLVPNDKAAVVMQIYKTYALPGTSLRNLALELTQAGIPGPKRTAWDSVTLSRILHSPLYVCADNEVFWFLMSKGLKIMHLEPFFDGEHACSLSGRRNRTNGRYNGAEQQTVAICNHKGFIDATTWLQVQAKLEHNAQLPRANAGKYSWLTGLLKCEICGYALKIHYIKKHNRRQLLCSGKANFGNCDAHLQVDLAALEDYIAGQLTQMLQSAPPAGSLPAAKATVDQILCIEQKIARLVQAIAESGEIAAGYITQQIETLHKQREILTHKSNQTKAEVLDFNALPFAHKKMVAAVFIEKIVLQGQNVTILWKI